MSTQYTCCDRPRVARFDYQADGAVIVNRVCTHCRTHWHGLQDQVRQYTGKEWDALLESDWNHSKRTAHLPERCCASCANGTRHDADATYCHMVGTIAHGLNWNWQRCEEWSAEQIEPETLG